MIRPFARPAALFAAVLFAVACSSSPAAPAGPSTGATASLAVPSSAASAGAPSVAPSVAASVASSAVPSSAASGAGGGGTAACIEKHAYDAYMAGPTSIETTSSPPAWDAFAFGLQHYDDPATEAWRTQLASALQKRDVKAADALGADLVSGKVKLTRCP
jgi:hypothetical protein